VEAKHSVLIDGRAGMAIEGVEDVISFGENEVILKTVMGELRIAGANMRVSKFDTSCGNFALEGKIDMIEYGAKAASKGFFAKVFS